MTVTDIVECSKSRSKVYIDYEFAFVLYKGELRMYHIKPGEEIAENDYQEIIKKILPKRARLRCLNLLKSRSYTEKQLMDKLLQGNYPSEIAGDAISYVKSFGYVDDIQYTKDYIAGQMNSRSKNRIRNDLWKKGIAPEIIDSTLAEMTDETMKQAEEEQIVRWLEKKKYNKNNADLQEKSRMFAFLCRKGFPIETIRHVLSLDIT